jgi:hypothetical protein
MRLEGDGDEPKVPVQLSVVAESRPQNPWVGLLARKARIEDLPIRGPLHLPRLFGRVVIRSDAPSLTVAGPRRICTGLPRYAPRGHPRQAGMLTQHVDWHRTVIVDFTLLVSSSSKGTAENEPCVCSIFITVLSQSLPLLSGPRPLSAFTSAPTLFTPVAGVLDLVAGGARPSFAAFAAAAAYGLLGRFDSWIPVRTRRSFYLRASRRLCCSGQCEKATFDYRREANQLAAIASPRSITVNLGRSRGIDGGVTSQLRHSRRDPEGARLHACARQAVFVRTTRSTSQLSTCSRASS